MADHLFVDMPSNVALGVVECKYSLQKVYHATGECTGSQKE
jgi:hypothetical protein